MMWQRVGWGKAVFFSIIFLLISHNGYNYINSGSGIPVSLVIAGTVVAFGLIYYPLALGYYPRKAFKASSVKDQAVVVEITPEYHRVSVPGKSESRIAWGSVHKVVETKAGFLVFTQENLAQWLPFSALPGQQDIDAFLEIATAHAKVIRRRK